MKKLLLGICAVIALSAVMGMLVIADDMEVDQVVSYVDSSKEGGDEESEKVPESTSEANSEEFSLDLWGSELSTETESEVETEPETENITEAEVETEVETEQETEVNKIGYHRAILEKNGLKISVPVFNEGDTWESKYVNEGTEIVVEYSLKKQKEGVDDYLVFSAEQYMNKLKDDGYSSVENSGVLESDSGLRYLGLFCSKNNKNYRIYYGGMNIGNYCFIVKITGEEDSETEDLIASEFGFKKLVKYRANQSLNVGFSININGETIDLPQKFDSLGWNIKKEEKNDDMRSSYTLEKDGYKINVKTYGEDVYNLSIMTYNCDVEEPYVSVFDDEVGFGSSEEELVGVLEELGLSYKKTETSNDGSQYTVEDEYNSGYTFIILNDQIYSISVFNQGYIFEKEMESLTETETE